MERIEGTFSKFINTLKDNNEDLEAINGVKDDIHSIKGLLDLVGLKLSAQTIAELEENVHRSKNKFSPDTIIMLENGYEKLITLVKKIENTKPKSDEIVDIDKSIGFESILVTFGSTFNIELQIDSEESLKTARALSLYNLIKRFANIKNSEPPEEDLYFETSFDIVKLEIVTRENVEIFRKKITGFPNVINVKITEPVEKVGDVSDRPTQDLSIRISMSYIRSIESSLTNLSYQLETLKGEILSTSGTSALTGMNKSIEDIKNDLRIIRKVPLDSIVAPFPAMTQRLAEQEAKDIEIIIQGRFITLDRSLANFLIDPLTQILRNSISHGIELPDDRQAIGKIRKGTIYLNAFSERDKIQITIADDGKGLNKEKIIKKLKKLEMDDKEFKDKTVSELIFLRGFSTSETSKISGRGLGLYSARERIAQIGGIITVDFKENEGTTFTISIPDPDTLSNVIIFLVNKKEYAVPSSDIEDILIVDNSDLTFQSDHYATLKYRDSELPVALVTSFVGEKMDKFVEKPIESKNNNQKIVIVCKGTSSLVGLYVDEIVDERLTNIKTLNNLLLSYSLYKGTILGKYKEIILVISPEELL